MEKIILNKTEYCILDLYDLSVTIPDSFVVNNNKTCRGHGEAKLYMGSKDVMRNFYVDDNSINSFKVKGLILKSDLIKYMNIIQHEYQHPSCSYRGIDNKKNMLHLWEKRYEMIKNIKEEEIYFEIQEKSNIIGNRGYVKGSAIDKKKENGYSLIREISLPFVSYISVMKLQNIENNSILFYWKLFADFSQMAELQYQAKNYGKKKNTRNNRVRSGQLQYKQALYAQYKKCPFTKIDDERLLIASHIKPWAVCNNNEKYDSENGIILSPLFDKLFDRGFISFDDNGDIIISNWLSKENKERIDFGYNVDDLLLTDNRKKYLAYHRDYVLK